MPNILPYNRGKAVTYAREWALSRNKKYYDFSNLGGDCTNFISQCLYAGSNIMNTTPTFGWYYFSLNNRAPAWTSVNHLYNFLIKNNKKAVFAEEVSIEEIEPGDIIQLANVNIGFYHSLLVTSTGETPTVDNVLICTHTIDSKDRPLNTYSYDAFRCLHILGVYQ